MELCRFVATPARHAVAKGPLPLRSTAAPLLPRRTLAVRSPAEPRVPRGRLLGASGIDEVSYVRATERKVETAAGGREGERGATKGEEGTVIEYEEAPLGGVEVLDFLKNIDLKLDSGDMYPILLYGTGAFVALWVSSAVVGALDALPLIPKVLEIVGLGFAVWFSYRYLVFKKNRDELSAKIQDLKEEILGPSDSYNY